MNSNVNNNDVIVEAEENDKIVDRGVEVNNNNKPNVGADNKEQSEEANIEDENSSKVIEKRHFLDISKWIDKIDENYPKQDKSTNLYRFELLIRGSRDGFDASKFHEKCDGEGETLVILKVKGTDEILGGYNHLSWNRKKKINVINQKTNKSFIFALDKNNINDPKIGRPTKSILSFNLSKKHGLHFARDLCLNKNFSEECKNFCKPLVYDQPIRDSIDYFSVEEYEVYKVIPNDSN
ncbi:hypothetical protein C2G38_2150254 [Gigaspora rosea]|uniref:TLDc domain-containing protein n=1 Tax=Gigaspora rosea TaxID=44941 RepID=A0A397TUR3_9GLOM|nr:hypothetical protein C2G38_2150254 [Gigaspora rosea]